LRQQSWATKTESELEQKKKKEKGVQAGHRNQEAAQAHHKDGEKIIWPENPNLVLEE
jgi:hypothetical protein